MRSHSFHRFSLQRLAELSRKRERLFSRPAYRKSTVSDVLVQKIKANFRSGKPLSLLLWRPNPTHQGAPADEQGVCESSGRHKPESKYNQIFSSGIF
jgi:hypothetical protein